jgi:hypothetical protein
MQLIETGLVSTKPGKGGKVSGSEEVEVITCGGI